MIQIWVKQNKQVVILVTAALLICGFIFLRLIPLHSQGESLEKKQSEQQALIAQAYTKAMQMSNNVNQLNDLRQQLDDYDLKVPAQADLGQFLGEIASLMDEHQLTEQMIEPQQEIQTEKLNCIPVTMKCKGRLVQIRAFYQSLQKLDRTVRIEKFKLSNDRELTGMVIMETEAVIYHKAGAEQG